MALRLGNTGRSIAVAKNNGYTIEKVQKAVEFVKHAKRRSTKLEDYLNMYNYLRGANETLPNCKICGSAKYIASVENYAKYGYLTLVASGVDPDILNGNKTNSDERSNSGSDVVVEGESKGNEETADTVETQESAQETPKSAEDTTSVDGCVDVDNVKESATESTKKSSVGRNKAKSKKSN